MDVSVCGECNAQYSYFSVKILYLSTVFDHPPRGLNIYFHAATPQNNQSSSNHAPATVFQSIVYVVVASGARPIIAVNVRVFAVFDTIDISLVAAVSQNHVPPVIRTLLPAH